MKKYICDNCGSSDTYVKKDHFEFERNNHIISFDSDDRFCSKCNSKVYDFELGNNITKKAINVYNQKYGISEDIKKIRNEIGLSLEELSNIIGCAKKTLISYEKGESIPNDTYLIVIKTIIDNPETIKTLINANKDMFETKKLLKIKNKLDKYFSENSKGLFLDKETEASPYNGYVQVDTNKLISIITILSKNGINKTKLLKELFYIDFLSYKRTVGGMTGMEYSELPYGPVLDDYENIFETLAMNDIVSYEVKYNDNYEEHIIKSINEPDLKKFRKEELDIIYKIQDYFKNYKVKDIVDYSHKEKAFTETNYGDKISYEYAFDLSID